MLVGLWVSGCCPVWVLAAGERQGCSERARGKQPWTGDWRPSVFLELLYNIFKKEEFLRIIEREGGGRKRTRNGVKSLSIIHSLVKRRRKGKRQEYKALNSGNVVIAGLENLELSKILLRFALQFSC